MNVGTHVACATPFSNSAIVCIGSALIYIIGGIPSTIHSVERDHPQYKKIKH